MAFDGSINAIIGADISQYSEAMSKLANTTTQTMSKISEMMSSSTGSITQKVGQVMGQLATPMLANVSKVMPQTVALFEKAGGQIQRTIASIGEKIPQPIKSGMSLATNAVSSAASEMSAKLTQQTGLIKNGFSALASKIPPPFKTAFKTIGSSTSEVVTKITSLGTQVGSKLTGSFNTVGSKAANALNNMTKNTKGATSATSGLIKQVIGVGTAFAGLNAIKKGITDTVSKAADFEQKMSNIKAVTGASSDTMKQFNNAAIKAGAETAFSASEAADAIGELSKAGVSTKDILNGGLTGALNLATAGELELKDSAEIASTALNAFKSDNLTVVDAANQLAGAANASATDVGELKYGLSMVSAVASGVGLSFNDTTDALAVFAQNGLKGSDAGTSLKTMLQNLQPSSKAAIDTMQQLGLMTADGSNQFFDAQGNIKSFADVSQLLKDKLSGLTAQQQQAALKTMFGSDAVRAATIAMNEGAEGAKNMQTEISKVTAADVAKEKLNNLKGAAESLSGSFETLQIKLGTAVLPMLTLIVQAVDKFVDKLGQSKGFDSFVKGISDLTPVLDHFINGTKLSSESIVKMHDAIQKALPIVAILGSALTLSAAVPAIASLSGGFSAFSGVLSGVVKGPFKLFSSGLSGLIGLIPKIGSGLSTASAVGMGALGGMTSAMSTIMQVALSAIGPAAILGLAVAGLGLINNQFGTQIDGMLKTVTTKGPEIITKLVNGITSQLPQLMASGTDLIAKLASAISTMIPVIVQAGIQIIGSLVQGVGQNASSLISSALQVVTSFISSIASALPQLLNMGMQLLLNIVNGIIQNIPQIVSSVQQILSTFVGSVTSNLPQIIQTGIQILLGLVQGITQLLPQLLPVALQAILTLIQGLMANIPQLMDGAVQIINSLANFIVQNLPMILDAAIQIIMALAQGILQNLPSIISSGIQIIVTLISSVVQMLPQIAAAGWDIIKSLAGAIWEAIPGVLQGAWDGIKKGFSGLWDTITGKSKETSTKVSSDATTTSTNLATSYGQANTNVTNSMSGMNLNVGTLSTQASTSAVTAAASANSGTTANYDALGSSVSGIMGNFAGSVGSNSNTAATAATNEAGNALNGVTTNYNDILSNVNQTTAGVANTVGSNMNQASSEATNASSQMFQNVSGNAKNINSTSSTEISAMTSNVSKSMNSMNQTVSGSMRNVVSTINSGFSQISSVNKQSISSMTQAMNSGMNSLVSAVSRGMQNAVSTMTSASSRIVSAFSYLGSELRTVGYNAGIGLNNGLASSAGAIYNTANIIASNVANKMRSALDVHSPSRVMKEIGGYVGQGLVLGMASMQGKVDDQALAYANAIQDQEFATRSVVTADTREVSGKISSSMSELSDEVQNSPDSSINVTIEQNWDGKKVYNYVKSQDVRSQNRINLINKK
ncbi:phage tail tape measure protein [Enterococcus faecium]|uniref:phage tail tape measure protein n=1 Tax=Enterococcus faecium TaxID=1352 RepID=UPI000BEFB46A|nr:phage tail tape measure protein [Enterococcus faecium]PEH49299.1 phage tail tape measure protein [Enterococcus faecium]